MKYTQGKYQVIENKALAKDIFSIVILCPEVAEVAVPGQFVHILPEGQTLRRPISICGIDRKNGTLRIVFIVKGVGTKKTLKRLFLSAAVSEIRLCFRLLKYMAKEQL